MSDYEVQLARERAERRAHAAAFAVLAGDVAALLGGTFQLWKDDDHYSWDAGSGNISIPGDAPILLHVSRHVPTGKGARFVARAVLPRDKSGAYIRFSDVVRELPDGRRSTDAVLEITADLSRGAEKIAADVRRRLLPDATLATAAVLRVVEQRDAYASGVMTLARELAPIIGAQADLEVLQQRDPNASRAHFYMRSSQLAAHGEVDIHGPDSVSIKVSGNAAQARAILAALASMPMGGAK